MQILLDKLHRFFKCGFRLAVLDMIAGKRWIIKSETANIPYLKAENANGRHILIQPEVQSHYLLADDITAGFLQSHHQYNRRSWKPGRMVIETSPGNHQVWIHASRALDIEEKRYWLKKMKSDPGADPYNRWGRCPGFRNRKQKYCDSAGGYPLAKLVWVDWRRQADIPKPDITKPFIKTISFPPQPLEGGVCRPLNTSRSLYNRNNESSTDFAYALALLRRGFSEYEVRECLLRERIDWKNHTSAKNREAYLQRTIYRAKQIVFST
jgi:hypothetical protein